MPSWELSWQMFWKTDSDLSPSWLYNPPTHLNLFEWHLEPERLIVIWVQRPFLDRRLLFLNPLVIHVERNLHVRIWEEKKVRKIIIWNVTKHHIYQTMLAHFELQWPSHTMLDRWPNWGGWNYESMHFPLCLYRRNPQMAARTPLWCMTGFGLAWKKHWKNIEKLSIC